MAAGRHAEDALSACTYIDIALLVLAHRAEQDFLAGQDAHVDARLLHLAVVVGRDAVGGHHPHLVAALDEAYRLALRLECM